jgi:hypothetical protein
MPVRDVTALPSLMSFYRYMIGYGRTRIRVYGCQDTATPWHAAMMDYI